MSNIGLIPFTTTLFSSHGEAGSFVWSKEGFANDPVYTLSFEGPAGKITVAVDDPTEFVTEIAESILNPEYERRAWLSAGDKFIVFKFAKELDVMDLPDDSFYCQEPSSWKLRKDGTYAMNRRGQQNIPAYLIVEVYSIDRGAPEGARTTLVAMAGMERDRVERLLVKVESECREAAGRRS